MLNDLATLRIQKARDKEKSGYLHNKYAHQKAQQLHINRDAALGKNHFRSSLRDTRSIRTMMKS